MLSETHFHAVFSKMFRSRPPTAVADIEPPRSPSRCGGLMNQFSRLARRSKETDAFQRLVDLFERLFAEV